MPANPKYLTSSGWVRFSRIMSGFVGGFAVTIGLHLVLTLWVDRATVIITSTYSGFILWAILLMTAFLIRRAWMVWAIYLGLILVFAIILFIHKNPLI